jgi:hypothetical protein
MRASSSSTSRCWRSSSTASSEHTACSRFLGGFYDFLIGSFEWLAVGVWVACVIFLVRRNGIRIQAFRGEGNDGWPKHVMRT